MRRALAVAAAILFGAADLGLLAAACRGGRQADILVIMADDVGYWNISAYNRGMMGYRMPTSTGLPGRARSSPIITAAELHRRAGRPSTAR